MPKFWHAFSDLRLPVEGMLGGETATEVKLTPPPPVGPIRDRDWLVVVGFGHGETIVAQCAYEPHARGVAAALALALDVPVIELL